MSIPEKLDHGIFVSPVAPRNTTIRRESWKQFDCPDWDGAGEPVLGVSC
jgi:hypothetical protein